VTTAAAAPVRIIRRRPSAPPVSLLRVAVDEDGRTRATGVLWDGPLNASPEDTTDGPSPVEALMAAVGACFVRNLRWVADGAHIAMRRLELDLAAAREDDPPSIRLIRMEVTIETDAPDDRVVAVVERALRSGTITRTVARSVELSVVARLNGVLHPVRLGNLRLR
jgi:uncharacterized OsmC-like protein